MAINLMSLLKEFFVSTTQSPSLRGSGRTTEMVHGVVDSIISRPAHEERTIIIVMPTLQYAKTIKPMLIECLTERGFSLTYPQQYRIEIGTQMRIFLTSIEQLENDMQSGKYLGYHPAPIRFLDHTTKEAVIAQGLKKIEQELEILKNGKYI